MAKKPDEPKQIQPPDEGGEIPWSLILSILGFLALVLLRRFLRLLFPMLFVLLVLVPMLWYLWRQYKYRDLWAVVPEYDRLQTLLDRLRLRSYAGVVQNGMKHLLAARDRAEKLQAYLYQEPPARVQDRIKDLQQQLADNPDAERRVFLEKSLADAHETLVHLEELQEFLHKYEDSKAVLAGHFKNTRLRIELEQMRLEEGTSLHSDDLDRLMTEIRTFDTMYETVDRRPGQGSGEAVGEEEGSPPVPPPDRQAQ
ncbi:MAG: hypothetical protein GX442_06620 [Candidatus Riflebacteria bacterium]|nr:hypothetical protein [Candidatus Riflebacteria bacterium]